MKPHTARFRFHTCLNDFLLPQHQETVISYRFSGHPGIKDPIEALGVPHSETGRIEVNGQVVNFSYQLQPGDRVDVHSCSGTGAAGEARFIVDVNLGKLARHLRLLGFDSLWRNDLQDAEIARTSREQDRIILTRDRRLLFRREIRRGYWVRAGEPDRQVPEVLNRLDLWSAIHPFRRCILCNGLIQVVAKERVRDKLEPLTRQHYDRFYLCPECGQIYWKGSHYDKLMKKMDKFRSHA
jgi:uncharacterized protein with PIN domain